MLQGSLALLEDFNILHVTKKFILWLYISTRIHWIFECPSQIWMAMRTPSVGLCGAARINTSTRHFQDLLEKTEKNSSCLERLKKLGLFLDLIHLSHGEFTSPNYCMVEVCENLSVSSWEIWDQKMIKATSSEDSAESCWINELNPAYPAYPASRKDFKAVCQSPRYALRTALPNRARGEDELSFLGAGRFQESIETTFGNSKDEQMCNTM